MFDCEKRIIVYYAFDKNARSIHDFEETLSNFFDDTVKVLIIPVSDESLVRVECITDKNNNEKVLCDILDYINNKLEDNNKIGEA